MKLETEPGKCTGCRICESFCSLSHEDAVWPARARIRIQSDSDDGPFTPNICRQCEDAACAQSCPVEAIVRDPVTSAWVVTSDCVGCRACVDACPYHAMYFNPDDNVAFKCDLCGGEPQCAAACPCGAVTLKQ